jgi:hypothetical protein
MQKGNLTETQLVAEYLHGKNNGGLVDVTESGELAVYESLIFDKNKVVYADPTIIQSHPGYCHECGGKTKQAPDDGDNYCGSCGLKQPAPDFLNKQILQNLEVKILKPSGNNVSEDVEFPEDL